MKELSIIIFAFALFSCNKQSKSTTLLSSVTELINQKTTLTEGEIKKLDSVNIGFQFRGNCYAYSSSKNAIESNGEAQSDNLPKKIDQSFKKSGLYLVINKNEFSRIDSASLGCKLYLVNTTDSMVTLNASDSRLYIIAEALNEKNEWTPISYLPSSWCGNSYHTVSLGKDEYWSFNIPVFKGAIKTKIRYTLLIDEVKKICSNTIDANLNNGQFIPENKKGHNPKNIMDPYNN